MSSVVTKIIQIIIMTTTIASVFFCSTKPDSADPSKAKFTPFIKTSDSIVSEGTFLDTTGKPITICAELFLPENFDSISLTITLDNQTVLDTVLREIVYNGFFDTIQMTYTFTSSGTYLITFTPYTSLNIKPAIISAVIAPRANHQPVITVSGKTNFLPGETCILVLQSSDPDSGQILTTSIDGQPEGSVFLNNTFTWVIPSDFTGTDTVEFSVTDNGTPPLCSTITVILTVAAETLNSAPLWSTDTIKVDLDDTSACSITLSDKCIDNDGDSLTFLLLQRAPDTDSIKDGVYSFRATPSSAGTWYPAIIAIDPHGASDTLIVKMTISQLPSSSVLLASIAFSAGTLREKAAPVPDTILDIVSFNDSALTITFTPFNIQSSITVNGSVMPTGTTTLPVNLVVGENGFQVILKSADNSISRSYQIIVLRKQNSIEPLISPPTGLKIDSVATTLIRIRWDDLLDATSYIVERSKMDTGSFVVTDTVGSNSFTDTGLEAGTSYYYRVNALNAAGSSPFSAAVGCTTLMKLSITSQPRDTTIVIGNPLILACTFYGPPAQIQWRRNGIDLPGKTDASLGFTAVTMADTGVYTVKIWNSADSVLCVPFRLGVLPAKPQGITATARSAFSVGVSWEASDGAARYIVLRSSDSGTAAAICTTSERSIIDTMLTEGAVYKYIIAANNSFGNSDTAASAEVATWKGPVLTTDLDARLTIAEGQSFRLVVVATGVPQCTFQWKKNGVDISGATSNELLIGPAYPADSGNYMVVVTNSVRSVNSKQVKVSVQPVFTLDVLISPSGSGTVSKIKDTAVYISGSMVTLNATPAPGYRFKDWGGDTSATGNTLSLVMKKDRAVTANFVRQYTLTMAVTGTGTTTPSKGATLAVDSGVATSISAVAGTGYKFKNWTSGQNGVVFDNATAANTGVKLTQGDATVMAVFNGITFSRTLSVSGEYFVFAKAIPGIDSGYVVVGTVDEKGFVMRLNTAGDVVSNKTDPYSFTGIKFISRSGDGYIITATTYGSSSAISYLASNCNFIWSKTVANYGKLARKTPDNGYIIIDVNGITGEYYVLKTNASGDSSWSISLNPGTYNIPNDCWPTVDGGYLIGGFASMGNKAYVVKLNNAGEKVWDSNYDEVFHYSNYNTYVNSVWEANDGYVIAGRGSISGNTSIAIGTLLKTDFNGTVLWSRQYSDFETITRALQIQSDGGYILAGDTYTKGSGGRDMYLVKTNSTGVIIWEKTFGTATDDEYLKSIEVTSDGGYLILGSTGMIIKTDENGNVE